ncbi:hypothetical protein Ddc_05934 [Ditylenchus destructor]|nr:hypothetical protein Ddc_05934 [Ditylenchus destructor]
MSKSLTVTTSNSERGIQRKQRGIIFQSFLIVGVLEARDLVLHGLPLLFPDAEGTIYLNVAHECIYIFSSTLTAIVVLIWNSEVRTHWIRIVCCKLSIHPKPPPTLTVNVSNSFSRVSIPVARNSRVH